MESNRNSIVPNLLDDDNYKTWSSCMENFLLSHDLWDVIEDDEPETSESTPDSSNNNVEIIWRKKNASAMHAIQMSCSPNFLSLVVGVKSAKQAWNLLASQFPIVTHFNTEIVDNDEQSTRSGIQVENDGTTFKLFVTRIELGSLDAMEFFIKSHPKALTTTFCSGGRTALHYASDQVERQTIAKMLMNRMKPEDLEIQDENGYTALALAAQWSGSDALDLMRAMVAKNSKLASIGDETTLPMLLAAKNGLKEATNFLYEKTASHVLDPNKSKASVALLIRCIDSNLFDVALKLVKRFPKILEQNLNDETFPILSFAKKFSSFRREFTTRKPDGLAKPMTLYEAFLRDGKIDAIKFLELVCNEVSKFYYNTLAIAVHAAMVEAARNGTVEFITPMLIANPKLFRAHDKKGRTMFWHAVVNRNKEIFNLIYRSVDICKDELLSCYDEDGNNIMHYAAMLPPMPILDRISTSPTLQIQRELQWFKEVCSLVQPHHRKKLNKDGFTPRELFDQSHKILMQSGERLMKETAQSCTTVGALIVTIMFAVAFTIPGGNKDTGYPVFKGDALFNIFIACDALSLSSSTASILIFLEILTSSYVNEDFVLHLPRKIMMGLLTLFISITTMMLTFCIAIAIMFEERTQYILPIALLASSPVVLFLSSIFSLVYGIYISTFGPSIFKRNTNLLGTIEELKEIFGVDSLMPIEEDEDSWSTSSNDEIV